ncbi:response regulator [Chloroflexota bacterium]
MTAAIRVMLVDDHAVVRSGLSAFLLAYDDLDLVGEASNGERALRLCQPLMPDVILMDLVMPGWNGAETTRRIRQQYPTIEVIALTSFKDVDMVQDVLAAGAKGYLLKNVSAKDLAAAIRSVHAGDPILASEITQALIEETNRPVPVTFDLSQRELEVLGLMVAGLNNREIAERLFVSRSTVKFHVSNILSKLGVTGRTEAVSVALKQNLVT